MVPWFKLSQDAQKTILMLALVSSGASVTMCAPIVCDPMPPPSPTRREPPTPVICDPMPPPSRTAPGPTSAPRSDTTRTPSTAGTPRGGTLPPIICDPMPPASTRTPTPGAFRRMQLRNLKVTASPPSQGAAVFGTVVDPQGQALDGIPVAVQGTTVKKDAQTGRDGTFLILLPGPGSYLVRVGNDPASAVTVQLNADEMATMDWAQAPVQTPLPLAEIRAVDIVWGDGLTFRVDTLWDHAQYRWSVSGGTLVHQEDAVIWQPPEKPGRYLLQLIADWGPAGLAVDSLVLTVNWDASIYIS